MRYNGAIFAVSNAVLVAGMCTYERYLMTSANLGMSAIDINFHRVARSSGDSVQLAYVTCRRGLDLEVLSMPMIAGLGYMEGFPATLLELATRRRGAAADCGPLLQPNRITGTKLRSLHPRLSLRSASARSFWLYRPSRTRLFRAASRAMRYWQGQVTLQSEQRYGSKIQVEFLIKGGRHFGSSHFGFRFPAAQTLPRPWRLPLRCVRMLGMCGSNLRRRKSSL